MNGQQRIQPAKNEEKLSTTRNCACGIGKFLCILYVYYMHGVIYGEPYTGTEDMGLMQQLFSAAMGTVYTDKVWQFDERQVCRHIHLSAKLYTVRSPSLLIYPCDSESHWNLIYS